MTRSFVRRAVEKAGMGTLCHVAEDGDTCTNVDLRLQGATVVCVAIRELLDHFLTCSLLALKMFFHFRRVKKKGRAQGHLNILTNPKTAFKLAEISLMLSLQNRRGS